jgi:hypothetical protein
MPLSRLRHLLVTAALSMSASHACAAVFGGVEFPQGLSSFADVVVSYDPVIKNGQPTANNRHSEGTVGAPDYTNQFTQYASLGDGGSITLQFADNRLTGSGSTALDIWIFEIGPDVEDTFVEISKDGQTWHSIGKVFGSTAGIDIDAFGFGTADEFAFVRLTDDGNEGDQTGASVGADIDAVGAISSVSAPIPEPATVALWLLGLAGVGARARGRGAS